MTPADFKAIFPAFKNVDDGLITPWIAYVDDLVDPGRCGAQSDFALANGVAHHLLVNQVDGVDVRGNPDLRVEANDVVTSKREHFSSTRHQKLLEDQAVDDYQRTVFGKRFRNITRQAGMGGAAV